MSAPEWFIADDLRPDQKERLERDWRNRPVLRPVARPVDVTDAEQFPNIAEAIEHARKLRRSA